jgi:hypothetical protein
MGPLKSPRQNYYLRRMNASRKVKRAGGRCSLDGLYGLAARLRNARDVPDSL